MRRGIGLLSSLFRYYGNPFRIWWQTRFYSQFIQPGDLCFDLGAHVGDRIWSWLQLGARVVALEPNPSCFSVLHKLYGTHYRVTLLPEAGGAIAAEQPFLVSESNPTMSTLSPEWARSIRQARQFAGVRWEAEALVYVTTLDNLMESYGRPAFCKIDVEGYEAEVLKGLSRPIRALSFEYNPATPELTLDCLDRLMDLGPYEFNWTVREIPRLRSRIWVAAEELAQLLSGFSAEQPTGDVYARLAGER